MNRWFATSGDGIFGMSFKGQKSERHLFFNEEFKSVIRHFPLRKQLWSKKTPSGRNRLIRRNYAKLHERAIQKKKNYGFSERVTG